MEIKITPKKNNDTTKTKSSIYQYENVNAFLEDLLCLNWAQGSLIRDEYKAEIKRFHEDCYLVLDEEKVGLFTQIRHLLESKGFIVSLSVLDNKVFFNISIEMNISEPCEFVGEEAELFSNLFKHPFEETVFDLHRDKHSLCIRTKIKELGEYFRKDGKTIYV